MENTKDNTDLNKNPSNEDNVTDNNVTDAPVVAAEPTSTADASQASTEDAVTPDLGLESESMPSQEQVDTPPETEGDAPVSVATAEVASVTPDSASEAAAISESPSEAVPVTVVSSETPVAPSPETQPEASVAPEASASKGAETQFTPTVLNAAPVDAGEPSANPSVLSIANDSPHAPGVKKGMPAMLISLLVLVLGLGLGFVAAGAAGFSLTDSGENKSNEIKAPVVVDKELTIPKDATIIAECAKGRGKQYVLPKDIPQGPVYNVWNDEVIGIEYMLGQNEVAANKDFLNLPLENVKYDHINIGLLSKGHSGFTDPHYHVDVFTISHEEASKITCQ